MSCICISKVAVEEDMIDIKSHVKNPRRPIRKRTEGDKMILLLKKYKSILMVKIKIGITTSMHIIKKWGKRKVSNPLLNKR